MGEKYKQLRTSLSRKIILFPVALIVLLLLVVDARLVIRNKDYLNPQLLSVLMSNRLNRKPLQHIRVQIKPPQAVNYFSIVSVSPEQNSPDNKTNTPIKITFSEPVRPGSLHSFFTVSPMIPGKFTQGDSPNQVVFTPKFPFGEGTSVKVILNKGFESVSGDKFASDYSYNFFTATADRTVEFQNGDIYSRWVNLPIGQKINFKLSVGSGVSSDSTISTYKATFDQIVSSLLYKNQSNPDTNYVTQTYINYPVDTTKMQKVSESPALGDGSVFKFDQGEGLYYIEEKSTDKVVGSTWVNVTNDGLIVRQDDQKIAIATQNMKTGEINNNVKILLYNLQDKPTLLAVSQLMGYGEISVPFSQTVDLVVGQTQNGVVLAPVSIPQTQADIRVTSDLSTLDKIYLSTDKPTYLPKDTVQYSGVLRDDNDAKYTLPPPGSQVRVWIPDPQDSTKRIVDQTVTIDAHGIFSGQFVLPDSLAPDENNNSTSITLYAKAVSDTGIYLTSRSFTTFDIVSQAQKARVTVTFDKQMYLKNQTITARVSVVDSSGNPLANQTLTYSTYTKDYFDNDPASIASFGTEWGEQTKSGSKEITLDKNGQASIQLDSVEGTGSRALTLAATVTLDSQSITGAKTVLVRQSNTILTFGRSREVYKNGETTVSRIYATDLTGNPRPNISLHYESYESTYDPNTQNYTETVLNQGDVKTDQNGFARILQAENTSAGSITMRVSTKDNSDNAASVERTMEILASDSDTTAIYYHDPKLQNLDVAADKLHYTIGDTANLTITAPFDQNVLVTYESGRIYHSEWLQLHKGDNPFKVSIVPLMAPSFNIIFSYFHNGSLFVEGLPLPVTNPANDLQVAVAADKTVYAKDDTAQLTITTKDNTGQPVSANVTLDIVDDAIFGLRDTLPSGDIDWFFYKPRMDTINATASTLGIGTGGGCGGGSGIDINYVPNRVGMSIYWNPNITTDVDGQAQITVPLSAGGTFRIYTNAVTDTTAVGNSLSTLSVQ